MSLKLATQVRNKMVSAYQDIARMQIWYSILNNHTSSLCCRYD
jgi:hypothetical protein